jgi:hypothetical protein
VNFVEIERHVYESDNLTKRNKLENERGNVNFFKNQEHDHAAMKISSVFIYLAQYFWILSIYFDNLQAFTTRHVSIMVSPDSERASKKEATQESVLQGEIYVSSNLI